jgi:AP-1-like factor
MEYPYFNPTPQPYQFLGLPPTPAHTGSANSDDFSNSPSVRDLQSPSQSCHSRPIFYHRQQPLSLVTNASFSPRHAAIDASFSPHTATNASFSPQAVTHTSFSSHNQKHFLLTSKPQDDYTQFQSFDYNSYVPNGLPPAKQPTPPQQKPIITANNGFDMQLDSNAEERRGSNSDDEDMTPAQSRRKAQNRAAYVPPTSPFSGRRSGDSSHGRLSSLSHC